MRALAVKRFPFVVQQYMPGDDFNADDSGGIWHVVDQLRGSVNPRAGKEVVIGGQQKGLISYVITCRKPCCEITGAHRLVRLDTGRVYNIEVVVPIEYRERWVEIQVTQTDDIDEDIRSGSCRECSN